MIIDVNANTQAHFLPKPVNLSQEQLILVWLLQLYKQVMNMVVLKYSLSLFAFLWFIGHKPSFTVLLIQDKSSFMAPSSILIGSRMIQNFPGCS